MTNVIFVPYSMPTCTWFLEGMITLKYNCAIETKPLHQDEYFERKDLFMRDHNYNI
jgi:hypothetical protein